MQDMWGFSEGNVQLSEGLNKNFRIGSSFAEEQDGQYGKQFYFEFTAGDMTIKHWVQPPNAKEYDLTSEDDVKKFTSRQKNFKASITQFFTGFYPESDDTVKKHFEANKDKVKSASDYVNVLKQTLPKDWQTRSVDLILYYKGNDQEGYSKYLSIPAKPGINGGRVFSASKDRELRETEWFNENIKGRKAKLEPQETSQDEVADVVNPDNVWANS